VCGPFSLHINPDHLFMTVAIQTNKHALQTWLADFLSYNIAVSERGRRLITRSDNEPEKQMHSDAQSHRESVRRDNESETGTDQRI
jgi:hypothetical protein